MSLTRQIELTLRREPYAEVVYALLHSFKDIEDHKILKSLDEMAKERMPLFISILLEHLVMCHTSGIQKKTLLMFLDKCILESDPDSFDHFSKNIPTFMKHFLLVHGSTSDVAEAKIFMETVDYLIDHLTEKEADRILKIDSEEPPALYAFASIMRKTQKIRDNIVQNIMSQMPQHVLTLYAKTITLTLVRMKESIKDCISCVCAMKEMRISDNSIIKVVNNVLSALPDDVMNNGWSLFRKRTTKYIVISDMRENMIFLETMLILLERQSDPSLFDDWTKITLSETNFSLFASGDLLEQATSSSIYYRLMKIGLKMNRDAVIRTVMDSNPTCLSIVLCGSLLCVADTRILFEQLIMRLSNLMLKTTNDDHVLYLVGACDATVRNVLIDRTLYRFLLKYVVTCSFGRKNPVMFSCIIPHVLSSMVENTALKTSDKYFALQTLFQESLAAKYRHTICDIVSKNNTSTKEFVKKPCDSLLPLLLAEMYNANMFQHNTHRIMNVIKYALINTGYEEQVVNLIDSHNCVAKDTLDEVSRIVGLKNVYEAIAHPLIYILETEKVSQRSLSSIMHLLSDISLPSENNEQFFKYLFPIVMLKTLPFNDESYSTFSSLYSNMAEKIPDTVFRESVKNLLDCKNNFLLYKQMSLCIDLYKENLRNHPSLNCIVTHLFQQFLSSDPKNANNQYALVVISKLFKDFESHFNDNTDYVNEKTFDAILSVVVAAYKAQAYKSDKSSQNLIYHGFKCLSFLVRYGYKMNHAQSMTALNMIQYLDSADHSDIDQIIDSLQIEESYITGILDTLPEWPFSIPSYTFEKQSEALSLIAMKYRRLPRAFNDDEKKPAIKMHASILPIFCLPFDSRPQTLQDAHNSLIMYLYNRKCTKECITMADALESIPDESLGTYIVYYILYYPDLIANRRIIPCNNIIDNLTGAIQRYDPNMNICKLFILRPHESNQDVINYLIEALMRDEDSAINVMEVMFSFIGYGLPHAELRKCLSALDVITKTEIFKKWRVDICEQLIVQTLNEMKALGFEEPRDIFVRLFRLLETLAGRDPILTDETVPVYRSAESFELIVDIFEGMPEESILEILRSIDNHIDPAFKAVTILRMMTKFMKSWMKTEIAYEAREIFSDIANYIMESADLAPFDVIPRLVQTIHDEPDLINEIYRDSILTNCIRESAYIGVHNTLLLCDALLPKITEACYFKVGKDIQVLLSEQLKPETSELNNLVMRCFEKLNTRFPDSRKQLLKDSRTISFLVYLTWHMDQDAVNCLLSALVSCTDVQKEYIWQSTDKKSLLAKVVHALQNEKAFKLSMFIHEILDISSNCDENTSKIMLKSVKLIMHNISIDEMDNQSRIEIRDLLLEKMKGEQKVKNDICVNILPILA